MCGPEESTVRRREASTRRWMHRSGNQPSFTGRIRRQDAAFRKISSGGACCDPETKDTLRDLATAHFSAVKRLYYTSLDETTSLREATNTFLLPHTLGQGEA